MQTMDQAYQNGAYIAGADAYPPRWMAAAQAFRDSLGAFWISPTEPATASGLIFSIPKANPKGCSSLFTGVIGWLLGGKLGRIWRRGLWAKAGPVPCHLTLWHQMPASPR